MAGKDPFPDKKAFTETVLARGTVLVHLDPRKKGVIVPASFGSQPQLVLQIGYHMPIPIPDLHLDEQGISATLSFNRSSYACFVPWQAVFAVIGDDGRGASWPSDLPVEIVAEIEREILRAQFRKLAKVEKDQEPASLGSAAVRSTRPPPKARGPKRRSATRPPSILDEPPVSLPDSEQAARPNQKWTPKKIQGGASTVSVSPARKPGKPRPLTDRRKGAKGKPRPLPPYLRVVK